MVLVHSYLGKHVKFRSIFVDVFKHGCCCQDKMAKETKEKFDKYYGANASSDYTVKFWFREIRRAADETPLPMKSTAAGIVTQENLKKIVKWCWVGRPESGKDKYRAHTPHFFLASFKCVFGHVEAE